MFAVMTLASCNQQLIASLTPRYGQREAASIARLVMDKLTGQSKSAWTIRKHAELSQEESRLFNQWLTALESGRPVQYVLEEAWFHGSSFFVDESVLIPVLKQKSWSTG